MFLERIKLLCKENGISQRKLEQELNLGNGATSKWVKSSPSIETLNRIANYFNVSVDYLLGAEPKEKAPALTKKDERPRSKLRSVARLEDSKITPEQDAQIADYIDFLLSKKKDL